MAEESKELIKSQTDDDFNLTQKRGEFGFTRNSDYIFNANEYTTKRVID